MSVSEVISYLVVPFMIFLIRIADVSMGTIRIIFISRGIRYLAAVIERWRGEEALVPLSWE